MTRDTTPPAQEYKIKPFNNTMSTEESDYLENIKNGSSLKKNAFRTPRQSAAARKPVIKLEMNLEKHSL